MTKRQGTGVSANYYGAERQRKKVDFLRPRMRTIAPRLPLKTCRLPGFDPRFSKNFRFLNALSLNGRGTGPHRSLGALGRCISFVILAAERVLAAQKCWMHVQHFEKRATLMGSPDRPAHRDSLLCAGPQTY
jgi:hypothetical protein